MVYGLMMNVKPLQNQLIHEHVYARGYNIFVRLIFINAMCGICTGMDHVIIKKRHIKGPSHNVFIVPR